MPKTIFRKNSGTITEMAASANVNIVPFLQNFTHHLSESALSISLGGDNTLVEVIATQTPGLAFPHPGNAEQALRIRKLAEKGFIQALSAEDLQPDPFRRKILAALAFPRPDLKINLNGAFNMSEKIKAILSEAE